MFLFRSNTIAGEFSDEVPQTREEVNSAAAAWIENLQTQLMMARDRNLLHERV